LPKQMNPGRQVGVLSKVPLLAAIMGRADAVKILVPSQMQGGGRVTAMANRMDLREGAQTQNIERLGNAADALTTALCQSLPPGPAQPAVIRVFAAWPKDWDAEFTLLCRGGFLVSSSMCEGHIEFVEIVSQLGGTCTVHNPWDGEVVLYRNGSQAESFTGPLFKFESTKDERLILVQAGTNPEQFKRQPFSQLHNTH